MRAAADGLGRDSPKDKVGSMAELVTIPGPRAASEPAGGRQPIEQHPPRLPPEPPEGLDLRHVLNVLKRRRAVILGCSLLMTVLAAIVVFQLTPRYTAETQVMLDTRKKQVVDMQAVMSGLQSDAAVVRSEVEVLQSPTLAAKVVRKLDLTSNKLFNPRLAPPSFWDRFNPVSAISNWVGPQSTAAPPSVEQQKQTEVDVSVAALLSNLTIFNDGRSYIIKIRVESPDPVLAASIANTYAELYLLEQLEAKFAATRRASEWLNDHLGDLQQKVQASDQAVQLFKQQHQLTQATKGITVASQQLSEVNSQLIIATADRAQKEANLRQVQDMVRSPGGADAATQVLASPVIQKLKEQQSQLRRQEAEMATRYRPAHPAMINIRAEISDVNKKIAEEVGNVVRGMSNEVNVARTREATLREQLQLLQKSTAQQDSAEVELRELDRQAEANRVLYETFLNRFKQTSAQQDIQEPDARLISLAQEPRVASFPKKLPFIGLAVILSVIVGFIAAFTMEHLDNGFRSAEQIEKLAGVPFLGMVPATPTGQRPPDIVVHQPVSSYAEAIRSVRTALRFSNVDAPPKIVLVTSSVPEEGKSVFSTSLARSVARSGGRALIIDCDLRHPTLSSLLGEPKGPDLVAMFRDGIDVSKLIQVDEASNLHYIPTRGGTANPQDVLGSQQMKNFLESMRSRYDLIVLDAPPVLAVTDALVLSHLVDAALFLIRWERTPRQIALGAIKLLQTQGRHLAGVVLTRVNVRKHATYGYGDYGYYYGRYGGYYNKEHSAG
jgi:polysaccharide biosynthesis transport protein